MSSILRAAKCWEVLLQCAAAQAQGQAQLLISDGQWQCSQPPSVRQHRTLLCGQLPGEKQVALTFIEVAEKRTVIVAKVGFDATSPWMCLASQ